MILLSRPSWKPSKEKLDIIRNELGDEMAEHFHTKYRIAKERCCNPKNKDYKIYKGKFHFKDFSEFFDWCYEDFKEAINKYNTRVSIDRIDGSLGYEPGNVRFVPMRLNLQNKSTTRKIKVTDVMTGDVYAFNSFGECCKFLHGSGALHKAYRKRKLYRKRYFLEDIEE